MARRRSGVHSFGGRATHISIVTLWREKKMKFIINSITINKSYEMNVTWWEMFALYWIITVGYFLKNFVINIFPQRWITFAIIGTNSDTVRFIAFPWIVHFTLNVFHFLAHVKCQRFPDCYWEILKTKLRWELNRRMFFYVLRIQFNWHGDGYLLFGRKWVFMYLRIARRPVAKSRPKGRHTIMMLKTEN